MLEHPINGMMDTAMENLKTMVDVNTIIGTPITSPDGTVVIPVSKVSFGLAAGGGEYNSKNIASDKPNPFAGGVGAGVSVSPVAFLVVTSDNVNLLTVEGEDNPVSKLLDYVPSMVSKVSSLFSKDKDKDKEKEVL